MDEYLRCLYEYIEEQRVGAQVSASRTYRTASRQASDLYTALTDGLEEVKIETLESFCSARDRANEEARRLLFLEGVALGKWMVR